MVALTAWFLCTLSRLGRCYILSRCDTDTVTCMMSFGVLLSLGTEMGKRPTSFLKPPLQALKYVTCTIVRKQLTVFPLALVSTDKTCKRVAYLFLPSFLVYGHQFREKSGQLSQIAFKALHSIQKCTLLFSIASSTRTQKEINT